MKYNEYVSLEMRVVSEIDGVLCSKGENCDIYGNDNNDNKMNLFMETMRCDFLSNSNGFYIEKVYHDDGKDNREVLLWVFDRYPYTLKYIEDRYGINSSIYRQAKGDSIDKGTNLFIFNLDKSIVVPVDRDKLIITKSENFDGIVDNVCLEVNQNNAVRQSFARVRKLYKEGR